jgi:hypothetical protein
MRTKPEQTLWQKWQRSGRDVAVVGTGAVAADVVEVGASRASAAGTAEP